MKKLLMYFAFGTALFLMTACGSRQAVPTAEETSYIPTDPSIPIEVTADSEFQIILESNPTTGYHWQIANSWDPNVFVSVNSEYHSTSPEGVVGGGGVDVLSFKAVHAGEDVLVLNYMPPGTDTVPNQTRTFTIKVK